MELTSPSFKNGAAIPDAYTCKGKDVSVPLSWTGVPSGTRCFTLICDDPDAPGGTWVHWVYYDIPATVQGLPEGVRPDRKPKEGGIQGMTDFRRIGYGGPCPPGGTHRYYFKLYALDSLTELEPGATKKQLLRVMQGHILAEAELMGTYRR